MIFRESGGEEERRRQRHIDVRDTSNGRPSHMLRPGSGRRPATEARALDPNQTQDSSVGELMFYPLSQTSRGKHIIFKSHAKMAEGVYSGGWN